MERKLIRSANWSSSEWLHALVCLIKCLRIQFKFSVLSVLFFSCDFSEPCLLFTLDAHSQVLIIMFALWHPTANCALMCFLLLHHSIRVPNLMLILNLKPALKQASPLLLPPAVLFYLYWFLNVIFLFERLAKDWTLARISISNSQTMFTSAQIWLQNLIKFHSKTNFFFF